MIPERIRKAFGAEGDAEVLGEESSTVRIGEIVLKKLDAFALKNERLAPTSDGWSLGARPCRCWPTRRKTR
jgi:hypothetical protein